MTNWRRLSESSRGANGIYDPGFGRRFSSSGRIGAVQFPVIQFLKLGADKPYRILLRYCNFHVHRERQLLKFSLESAMLEELLNSFHNFILKQKAEAANPFRDDCFDFFRAVLQQPILRRKEGKDLQREQFVPQKAFPPRKTTGFLNFCSEKNMINQEIFPNFTGIRGKPFCILHIPARTAGANP